MTDFDRRTATDPVAPTNRGFVDEGPPTPDGDPRDDADVRAERLEHEIDRTREDMTETVQAISEKLDPGNIAREATDSVRHAALGKVDLMAYGVQETWREVKAGNANGIIDTLKSNPIPAGMVALGLGFLFMNRGQRAQQGNGTHWRATDYEHYPYGGNAGRSPVDGIASTVGSAVDQVGDRIGEVGDTVGRVADDAGQRMRGFASTAGEAASGVPRQAGDAFDQGTGQVRRFMDQSPLAAGLVAVAAGAILGLVLPSTQVERRTLGQARDDLVDKAEQTANELVDKAESVNQAQGGSPLPSGTRFGAASESVSGTEALGS
jgi:hypothetical protein